MKNRASFSLLLIGLFFSSLIVAITADDNTMEYYVDGTDGDDTNNDGTSGSPFASLNGALTAFTTAQADDTTDPLYNLIINVKKGNYTGDLNLQIPFFVNTTVQNQDDEDNSVFFICDENNSKAFNPLYGSFQLFYVTIQDCQRGVNVEYKTIQDYQDVYVDHVIFQGISLNAIWIEYASSIAVKDSIFENPSGDSYLAYINVIGNFSSGMDIINNEFNGGSGIQITNMNGGNINDNTFDSMSGNTAEAPPAIYITGGVWDIEGNTFNNISSTLESAVTFYAATSDPDVTPFGNFSLTNNDFTGCNTTGYYGGAVAFYGVLGEVQDCTFTGNQAELGGAIFLSASNVTIQKSTFENNFASKTGGAIDIEKGSFLFLYDNDFESNTAGVNSSSNSLSCCITEGAGTCTSSLIINDGDQGDFSDSEACNNISYVSTNEYFESLASYAYQPFTTPGGSSLWWVWMLVSFALIAVVLVVGVAVGAFVYTKKKRSYEAYA